MSKRIGNVVPKYYPDVNAEAIDVKPISSEEQKKMNNRLTRKTEKLTYPVYTSMNKQDMKTITHIFGTMERTKKSGRYSCVSL